MQLPVQFSTEIAAISRQYNASYILTAIIFTMLILRYAFASAAFSIGFVYCPDEHTACHILRC